MSHFYASIPESARKTEPTARGHKSTGIITRAASWAGAVVVRLWHDEAAEVDRYEVTQDTHHGAGVSQLLCSGAVGERVGTSGQIGVMVRDLESIIDGQDPTTDDLAAMLSPIADLLVALGRQRERGEATETGSMADTQAEQVKWTALMGGLIDALSTEGAATGDRDNPAVQDRYHAAVGILERLASDLDDLNHEAEQAYQETGYMIPSEIGGDYLAVYQAATAHALGVKS